MKSLTIAARVLAAAACASTLLVATGQSASAVGGSCYSTRQEDGRTGPNAYRVRAYCTSLQGDSKAKGVLDIAFANDVETSWFTTLNTYRYSDWVVCWPNSCNNTRVDIAHV